MKFPYLKLPSRNPKLKWISRPYIPIRLIGSNGIWEGYGLIDSGADRNLLPLRFATGAGIQFKKTKPRKIYGIGSGYIDAYTAKVNLWVGTKKYETMADFSPQQNVPILGRDGFFNLFKSIKFDESGKFVYLEEI